MQNHVKFSELTPDNLELDFLKENAVIVRIWTSAQNFNTPTGNNVGHVSLELRKSNRYISLWPRQNESDFILLSKPPSEYPDKTLPGTADFAYALFKDDLYYINKRENQSAFIKSLRQPEISFLQQMLDVDSFNLHESEESKCLVEFLKDKHKALITQLTGHIPAQPEESGITEPVAHQFNDYKTDYRYENRIPEYTFCLYTLDNKAIDTKFNEYKDKSNGWCLIGHKCTTKNVESCVSLVKELLLEGGMEKLISRLREVTAASTESSKGSGFSLLSIFKKRPKQSVQGSLYSIEQVVEPFIPSPDGLVKYLEIAKNNELKIKPLTKDISEDIKALNAYSPIQNVSTM